MNTENNRTERKQQRQENLHVYYALMMLFGNKQMILDLIRYKHKKIIFTRK
jgi:hypothetical protein